MSDAPRRGLSGPFLVACLITLGVLALRLYGEVEKWDPRWFSAEPGGRGAWVGISWLMPVFGFWFGRRLAQAGSRPARTGRSLLMHLLGFGLAIGLSLGARQVFTDSDARTWVTWIGFPTASLFALCAWPRSFFLLLGYGIVARGAVIAITHWAFDRPDWQTHFTALPPSPDLQAHLATPEAREFFLSMAQATLWIPGTILIGGFFATLGAATVRKA